MRQYFTASFLAAVLSGCISPAWAQSSAPFGFEYRDVAKVVHGTYTLRNPWVGGLNSPQFSNIDLNADQEPDLFVFDRAVGRVFTFLSVATPTGRAWQYAPEYETLFPAGLQSWVLLRDYDCDNRPDLFTYGNGGNVRVYRHVPDAQGRPGFQLVTEQLNYFDPSPQGGNINITAGGYNMPDIRDVNGDGRLDIVTFDFASSAPGVNYFLNTSTTACGGLDFRLGSEQWGGFSVCLGPCTGFVFNKDQCQAAPLRPQHTGGFNISLIDLDGDGDQDVLTGRDNCPELVSLRNDGTPQTALMPRSGLSAGFPAGTQAARVPNFPAAYLADVTFDGRPDVLVAPNLYDNVDTVETRQSVWLYRNAGTGAAPTLVREQTDFLQRDIVDLSEDAAPTFGDVDGDGLVDMLVGSVSRNNARGYYRASLSFYRNTGTATQPVFELVTNDYLGLVSRKHTFIKPVLADLNQDRALDLAYSATTPGATGTQPTTSALYYVLNTAGPGKAAVFNTAATATFANLPATPGNAPCFTDVDGDGRLDLLLGTNSGDVPLSALRYYRNVGAAALSQTFVLQDADFGQLRTATGTRPGNLHPAVADFDGDGRPDLLTADASGQIRFFSNYRAQTGAFTGRTDLFFNSLTGQFQPGRQGLAALFHYAPAAADVNGDGAPELFLGLEGGGISSFVTRNRLITSQQPTRASLPLQVYPNPAVATATVEAAEPVRVTVLDLAGRVVRVATPAARRHQLNLAGLAAGIYLVRCQALTGETAVRRLEVTAGQ
ncbi:T9SS C-terminal target domain-containing protein [Hymenobacter sediminis]|uniref:T9SS type A sorting domain-containing protein n=1 Tax=Hymenobacter sediminis TaxID=2218621 RepID=UPI000DA6C900|nr:T9SS type A sorting domain-containing protein [Hymenobacter sediminis]RPD49704.1 T9SS C-terminal target domain-containing protein [Hymenobacter sediminis]